MKKVVAAGLLAVVATMMIGCGSDTASTKEESTPAPKEITKEFMTDLQKADLEAAAKLIDGGDKTVFTSKETKESEKVLKDMLGQLTYEFGEEKIDGKKATVQTKVNAVDFTAMFQKTMENLMGDALSAALADPTQAANSDDMEKKAQDVMEKAIKDPTTPKKSTDLTVNLVKTKDGWKLDSTNDQLITAAFGLN